MTFRKSHFNYNSHDDEFFHSIHFILDSINIMKLKVLFVCGNKTLDNYDENTGICLIHNGLPNLHVYSLHSSPVTMMTMTICKEIWLTPLPTHTTTYWLAGWWCWHTISLGTKLKRNKTAKRFDNDKPVTCSDYNFPMLISAVVHIFLGNLFQKSIKEIANWMKRGAILFFCNKFCTFP